VGKPYHSVMACHEGRSIRTVITESQHQGGPVGAVAQSGDVEKLLPLS